jgi:hypothetical protein
MFNVIVHEQFVKSLSDDLRLWVADKKELDVTKAAKLVDEHTEMQRALETEQADLQRALQTTYIAYNEHTRQPTTTYSRQSPMNQSATRNTQQDYQRRGQSNWNQNQNRPHCS